VKRQKLERLFLRVTTTPHCDLYFMVAVKGIGPLTYSPNECNPYRHSFLVVPVGVEPTTSRVSDERSNQAELWYDSVKKMARITTCYPQAIRSESRALYMVGYNGVEPIFPLYQSGVLNRWTNIPFNLFGNFSYNCYYFCIITSKSI
jgi:hypothetical protein